MAAGVEDVPRGVLSKAVKWLGFCLNSDHGSREYLASREARPPVSPSPVVSEGPLTTGFSHLMMLPCLLRRPSFVLLPRSPLWHLDLVYQLRYPPHCVAHA